MAESPDQVVAEMERARESISRTGELLMARLKHDISPSEQVRDHYPAAVVVAFGLGLVVGLIHD